MILVCVCVCVYIYIYKTLTDIKKSNKRKHVGSPYSKLFIL